MISIKSFFTKILKPIPIPITRKRIFKWSLGLIGVVGASYYLYHEYAPLEIEPEKKDKTKIKKILCIDGGGMRGVIPIKALKAIESRTGKPVHELFDMIVGTSTGAILAIALGKLHMSLDECEDLYANLGTKIFDKTWTDKFYMMVKKREIIQYDSDDLVKELKKIIKEKYGNDNITLKNDEVNNDIKIIIISATATTPIPEPFLFRNYDDNYKSPYPGSNDAILWQAIRASTAAHSYFDKLELKKGLFLQDGGMVANNPTKIALRELEKVFGILPKDLDCILSIGTGDSSAAQQASKPNTKRIINQLISLATGSKETHLDIREMKLKHYFRINPSIPDIPLDVISNEVLQSLIFKTNSYMRQQWRGQLDHLTNVLLDKVCFVDDKPATLLDSLASFEAGFGNSIGRLIKWRCLKCGKRPYIYEYGGTCFDGTTYCPRCKKNIQCCTII